MRAAAWPVIATDPNWELRQGPTISAALDSGAELTGTLVWSTSDGFTAELAIDDAPIDVTGFTADDFDKLAEVAREISAHLEGLVPA